MAHLVAHRLDPGLLAQVSDLLEIEVGDANVLGQAIVNQLFQGLPAQSAAQWASHSCQCSIGGADDLH